MLANCPPLSLAGHAASTGADVGARDGDVRSTRAAIGVYKRAMSARRVLRLLAWAVLAWAGSASAQGEGPTLRVGVGALPATLDPATAIDGPAALIARQVFDTLVQYREGGSDVEAGLATEWAVSRDGLAWTFRLRDGVRFHDGTPLTAAHAAASLERQVFPGHALAPSAPAVAPRLFRGAPGVVKEIKALDARTLRIQLAQPYAPLPTVLGHAATGIGLPVPADGGGTRWIGTGPFAVAEVAPGRIALDAQRGYWGGQPRLARVAFLAEPDGARALESRAIDVWMPDAAPGRRPGAVSVPGWRIGFLAIQTERDPLSRRKARAAIAAAIDPARIGAAVDPIAAPLASFVPPGVWGRGAGSPVTQGDPAAARKHLAEAGLGRGLSSTLLVVAGSEEQRRIAEALRASLAPAGIALQLQAVKAGEIMGLAQNGEHRMVLMEAQAEGGDPHLLLYPLSTSEAATKGSRAWNLSFYRNPRLDDLLIRASQLSFRLERQRVYARAQQILAEDLPWIPLYVRLHWAVVRPEVRGLRLHPSGQPRLDRVSLD